jgi:hypothetical protein
MRNVSALKTFLGSVGVAMVLGLSACGSSSDAVVKPRDGGTGGTGPGTATGGSGSGGIGWPGTGGGAGSVTVGTAACSDGMDNDGDGKTDYEDPECVGPLDNDEGTFATGISGDNMDACKQDCFFDGDSGGGNDGCDWQLKCDPSNVGATAEKKCPYDADFASKHTMECSLSNSQSPGCVDFCGKLTPNGCDCFGCCVVPGATTPIRLSATCTADKFDDPNACHPCTQVTACNNPCERCEICIGKTTLPPDCNPNQPDGGTTYDGGTAADGGYTPPPPQCPGTITSCGPGGQVAATACPAGTGCVTGCCVPIIP